MDFFRRLFDRLFARSDAAAERIASALEGIATDMEALRADTRARLNYTAPMPPALPAPADAVPDATNGRARKRATHA